MERKYELESLIKKYATSYYLGESEVSDEYFDSLVEELREIDPSSPMLTTGWGFEPERKINHWYGLYIGSLTKKHSVDEIPQVFYSNDVRISAKLDGISVVSYYVDGKRVQCLTRGTGTAGIDVTDKMEVLCPEGKFLKNLDGTPFSGAVRGEVVMPNSSWDTPYYREKKENNPSLNSRNVTAGLMSRHELSEDLCKIDYVVYKILAGNSVYSCIEDVNLFFINNGLKSAECIIVMLDSSNLTEEYLKVVFEHFKQKYPCDGLVFTKLGEDFECEEISYKFPAERKQVVVKNVTYSATRTGRMAPRVWFDPVELSGAMVEKATGFNAAFIRDNRIGKGAVLEVCRSGEVIPHIVKVVKPLDEWEPLEVCPNCGADLDWRGDDLICPFENESQLAYRFITTCAPVDGAGWSLYSQVVDGLNLNNEESLCKVLQILQKPTGISDLTDFLDTQTSISGEVTWSKVSKILSQLASEINPVVFLVACNIRGLSWSTVEKILEVYPEFIEDIKTDSLSAVKLSQVPGVGYHTIETIEKFSSRIKNLALSVKLATPVKKEKIETQFKVAITGALSMKRADFDEELNKRGIVQSSNFNEIKYLITDKPNSTSSKMRKAQEKDVEIISEEEFVSKYFN